MKKEQGDFPDLSVVDTNDEQSRITFSRKYAD